MSGSRRMSVPDFVERKGKQKLVCLTAYDVATASILDAAGVDLILVGDSLGMVVHGHSNTLRVTLDHMVAHAAAVVRARPRALVVADMPFLTFHISPEETVRNAGRLVQEGGVDAVKLEGGTLRVPHVQALLAAGIPVMGHVGLTPQSVLPFGGHRVQGRGDDAAERILADAAALEAAGCFSIVLEGMPASLAGKVTRALRIPTIGIGAGAACDGQILVVHDLLGLFETKFKFVRRYADLRSVMIDAVSRFRADVVSGAFPSDAETYEE